MTIPAIGDVMAFRPAAFFSEAERYNLSNLHIPQTLRGTVIAVNMAHRHYTLEACCHGYLIRETFKY